MKYKTEDIVAYLKTMNIFNDTGIISIKRINKTKVQPRLPFNYIWKAINNTTNVPTNINGVFRGFHVVTVDSVFDVVIAVNSNDSYNNNTDFTDDMYIAMPNVINKHNITLNTVINNPLSFKPAAYWHNICGEETKWNKSKFVLSPNDEQLTGISKFDKMLWSDCWKDFLPITYYDESGWLNLNYLNKQIDINDIEIYRALPTNVQDYPICDISITVEKSTGIIIEMRCMID